MNILAISDQKAKALYDYFNREKLEGVDLILSAGDLPPQYLSFLVTFTQAPLLYVRGNHDDCYAQTPPDGCICVDGDVYTYKGIRIMGMGGSMRYRDGDNQYSPFDMKLKTWMMGHKIRKAGGVDILLTHAPAKGLGDDPDLPHQGFEAFNQLLDKYHPKYMVHGHVHLNYGMKERVISYGDTTIINAFEQYRFEYETGRRLY